MRVKICGLKNLVDAELALSLGATELGFIFTKSPRRIEVLDAKHICQSLPKHASTIGVFKNDSIETISRILNTVALKGIQLHGVETSEFVDELKKKYPKILIFKMIGVEGDDFSLDPNKYHNCDALIFDSIASHFEPEKRGIINSRRLENYLCANNFFIAGGINPDNVKEQLIRYRPSGIDVSSGVEISPGVKDAKLMKNLFLQLKDSL